MCCFQGRAHATAVIAGEVSVISGTMSASIVPGASCRSVYPDCAMQRLQNSRVWAGQEEEEEEEDYKLWPVNKSDRS